MANSHSNINSEIFSLEDCEALLNFPYHEYSTDERTDRSESETESNNLNCTQSTTINSFDSTLNFPVPYCITHKRRDVISETEIGIQNPNCLGKTASEFLHEEIKKKPVGDDLTIVNECLAVNLSLQKKLQKALDIIQVALEKNLSQQEKYSKVQQAIKKRKTKQKGWRKPNSLFASPYFRDLRNMVPPDNEDTIEKRKRNDLTAHHRPPKPWQPVQLRSLTKGVEACALDVAVKPYTEKHDYLMKKLENKDLSKNEINLIKMEMEKLEKEINIQSGRPTTELLKEAEGKLDWMTISDQYLNGKKSDFECEIMWNNYLSIFVNKNPFTEVEDCSLQILARKYKEKNWDAIAKELNSNRTAIQCFERYQNYLKKKLTKHYWTPEDDEKLKKAVNSVRRGNYIPWQQVQYYMEGWSYVQIYDRYTRALCRNIRRTPFTVEEDAVDRYDYITEWYKRSFTRSIRTKMIIACIKTFGSKFAEMKQFLPGRQFYAIKDRYVNYLDPTIKTDEWTEEEDVKLMELLKEHGSGKWKEIAQNIPHRSTYMCMKRIMSLQHYKKQRFRVKKKSVKGLDSQLIFPSNACLLENMRLTRNEAIQALKTALENIRSKIHDSISIENLDLSSLSVNELKILHEELFKDFNDDSTENYTPRYICDSDFIDSENDEQEVTEASDNDDHEGVADECEGVSVLNEVEKLWLHEALEARLREEAQLVSSYMEPKVRSFGKTIYLECEHYTNFLRKKFFCHEKSEGENWNQKDNFQHSFSKTIRFFIGSGVEENSPIVLSPNFATASAFEIIETTKERLQRTSSFINKSKPYLAYLMGYVDKKPKCSKCKTKRGNATQEVFENVLKSMQDRFLIVDEIMQKSAEVETGFSSTTCKCKELADSKEAFNLLQKRFLSIFLWPSLLSMTDLNPEQEKLVAQPLLLQSKAARKRVRKRRKAETSKQPFKKLHIRSKRKIEESLDCEHQTSAKLDTSSSRRSCRISAIQRKQTNLSDSAKRKIDEALDCEHQTSAKLDTSSSRRSCRISAIQRKQTNLSDSGDLC